MGVRLSTCSIAGAHTARSVSARHAQSSYQSPKRTMGRSLGSPCLAACITSIIWRHDASDKAFAPYRSVGLPTSPVSTRNRMVRHSSGCPHRCLLQTGEQGLAWLRRRPQQQNPRLPATGLRPARPRISPPQGSQLHASAAMIPQNHPLDSLKTLFTKCSA